MTVKEVSEAAEGGGRCGAAIARDGEVGMLAAAESRARRKTGAKKGSIAFRGIAIKRTTKWYFFSRLLATSFPLRERGRGVGHRFFSALS
jgi:hypothetical protein